MQQLFQSKKPFCRHPNGCIEDALHYGFKSAKYGLIISSILQFVKSLRAWMKNTKAFKSSFSPEYLTIAIFLSSTTLVLRLVKCALRWIRDKQDGWNSFIAGIAAGWVGTKTLSNGYWYLLLMFIGSRLIGVAYQSLIQQGYLDENNSVWHYYVMFFIAHSTHSYGYFIQPDILRPDMYNLYQKMSALTPEQKKWHASSLKYQLKIVKDNKYRMFDHTFDNRIKHLEREIKLNQNTG